MDLAPFTPKQVLTLQHSQHPEARINLWVGSVRSGKTINSLIAWVNFIVNNTPRGPLLMAARTTDTLRRNVLDPLTELIGEENITLRLGDGKATILGRTVHLVGADNTAAESRIRGLTLAGSYVDELTILGGPQGEAWWRMLLTRHSLPGAKVFATTNPDHPNHWLLKDFISKATLTVDGTNPPHITLHNREEHIGLYHYKFTLDDNTTLPTDYINTLKASLAGVFYDRFILGEWVAGEGSVFPLLTPSTAPTPPHLHTPTIGIDVGTTNPTHAVLVALDEHNQLWVMDEHRNTDPTLTFTEQVTNLLGWIETLNTPVAPVIVVDPSAKAFRNEWHRQTRSWPWQADNAVLPGISDISALLKNERLHLTPTRTPVLYSELQGYRWDSKATLHGIDKPVKEDDHGVDALRYAVRALKKHWEPTITTQPQHTELFVPKWQQNAA